MRINRSDIPNVLGLKTVNTFDIAECYSVGMSIMGPPSNFLSRFVDSDTDTHHKTQNQDDKDIDIYDVWAFDDSKYECRVCGSPEAIDRAVKITKSRIPGTNEWVEDTEYLYPLCNDCAATKLSSSGTYVGVTMPPPSGDITSFVHGDEGDSLSSGYERTSGIDRKNVGRKMEYWSDGRKIKSIEAYPTDNTRYASLRVYD